MRDMVNDDAGIVEIYDFSLPQYSNGDWTLFSPRYQPGEQKPQTSPAGSFNLNMDNDEAIDLEKPNGSSGGGLSSTGSSAGS